MILKLDDSLACKYDADKTDRFVLILGHSSARRGRSVLVNCSEGDFWYDQEAELDIKAHSYLPLTRHSP